MCIICYYYSPMAVLMSVYWRLLKLLQTSTAKMIYMSVVTSVVKIWFQFRKNNIWIRLRNDASCWKPMNNVLLCFFIISIVLLLCGFFMTKNFFFSFVQGIGKFNTTPAMSADWPPTPWCQIKESGKNMSDTAGVRPCLHPASACRQTSVL